MAAADARTEAEAAPTARPAVLLTGFGPFPGVAQNATALLVPKLADAAVRAFPGIEVHHAILPTEWAAAPRLLDRLLADIKPWVSLHFGVSAGARGFAVETTARNIAIAAADAAGCHPTEACLATDGPECRVAGPETEQLVAALQAAGLPAYLSSDAGTYLCNGVLYHALGHSMCGANTRSYFVHVPSNLVGSGDDGLQPSADCPLDWDSAVAGGIILLSAALDALTEGSPAGEGTARLRDHAGAMRGSEAPDGR
jgi:pyroglutamyl-peptidase